MKERSVSGLWGLIITVSFFCFKRMNVCVCVRKSNVLSETVHDLNKFRIHITSYPCRFREVDCDSEVFFLRLPPVRLRLVAARLSRCCNGNALLLRLLLVFLYFLLTSAAEGRQWDETIAVSKLYINSLQVWSMLCVQS